VTFVYPPSIWLKVGSAVTNFIGYSLEYNCVTRHFKGWNTYAKSEKRWL